MHAPLGNENRGRGRCTTLCQQAAISAYPNAKLPNDNAYI